MQNKGEIHQEDREEENLERDESPNCFCSFFLEALRDLILKFHPPPRRHYLEEGRDLGVFVVTVVKPVFLQDRQYIELGVIILVKS